MSQGYVAAVLAEQGDTSRALDLLQQARVIIARLVEQSPANHQLSEDLAMFDDNIAKLEQANAPGSGADAAQPEQAVVNFHEMSVNGTYQTCSMRRRCPPCACDQLGI